MILLVVLLAFAEPHLPVPCDQIRSLVAEHGKVKAIYWARSHGFTWAQIAEARKCLK